MDTLEYMLIQLEDLTAQLNQAGRLLPNANQTANKIAGQRTLDINRDKR